MNEHHSELTEISHTDHLVLAYYSKGQAFSDRPEGFELHPWSACK